MAEADPISFAKVADPAVLDRVGDRLRRARELAGLKRRDIAFRTKINERHLAAIEGGDFAALPGRAYAVGFARSYASALGLDGAAIAADVRRELTERDALAKARPSHRLDLDDPAKVPSRRLAWLAGASGLAVIAVGAVFWRSYLIPAVELPPVRGGPALTAVPAPALNPGAPRIPNAESALDPANAQPVPPQLAAVAPAASPQSRGSLRNPS
ncbi:MAG: helix-turn-helix domain-containing protein [Novosphingobium sp.]